MVNKPLPITEEQAAFLAKRQGMDPSYFTRSEEAQRKSTAMTLGRLAKWDKLGLVQGEVKS